MSNPALAKPVRLEPGQAEKRRLAEGETHPYLVRLEPGEYVRIVAEQRGVDLVLRLLAPNRDLIGEVESPTGTRGAERVSEIATAGGDYHAEVMGGEGTPPGAYEIRIEELRTATAADRKRGEGERVFLEGEGLRREHRREEAITRYERALALYKQTGDLSGQATVLSRIGWIQERLDQWGVAADFCLQAADVFERAEDTMGLAAVLNRYGRALAMLGRYEEALAAQEKAIRLFQKTENPEGESSALNNLENVHNSVGRLQKATDAFDQALALQCGFGGDRREEIATLLSLGDCYLAAGKRPEARDRFDSAMRLAKQVGDREHIATALVSLGELDHQEGNLLETRERLGQAINTLRELRRRRGEAIALNALGTTLLKAGDPAAALARWEEALALFRALGDTQGEATALSNQGRAAFAQGELRQAFALHQQGLTLFERLGNPEGQASTRYGSAQALASLDDLDGALREIEACVKMVESLRTTSESLDLRAFYFASKQHYWDLYIDVLMSLHERHPGEGFAARALEASEKRRARSLLDALAEVRANARRQVDSKLLQEEVEIRDQLNRAKWLRNDILQKERDPDRIGALEREIRDHLIHLDRVRTRMRRASPRLAELEMPATLSLEEIRQRLLDANTLLLVYSLGDDRSFLWKVTCKSLESYVLPGRVPIESAAQFAHDVLSHRLRSQSRLRSKVLKDLAALVLAPMVGVLPRFRRLLIVPDGALQLVPFATLPDPGVPTGADREGCPLLVERQEIVYLPSASVALSLRREGRRRGIFSHGPVVALVADPVFDSADPRVRVNKGEDPGVEGIGEGLIQSARDLDLNRFERLPYSRREAETIEDLWPGEVLAAFDFAARREVLADKRWRHARILHFATHSLFDDRHPELSGLVFSQVNPDGTPRLNEFLPLHEIYDLDLEADLVVLSACQTGVGRELWGEGLQALTRGFMAAGVPEVIVSLWKVEDRATAELMIRFYRELFDGQRPSEALRNAQISMLREPGWDDPFFWAGFVIQGDSERRPGTWGRDRQLPGGSLDWMRVSEVDNPQRRPILRVKEKWNLAETGWGVIFAPGIDHRVRGALAELLELREAQATRGGQCHYFEVGDYRPGESTREFLDRHHVAVGTRGYPEGLPYYLLLVGDPEALPFTFQYELDVNHAVGRICFERPEDYLAYARSVVRAETCRPARPRRMGFFGPAHPNDEATKAIYERLIEPLAAALPRTGWELLHAIGLEARKERLRSLLGGAETPALLIAACHGLGLSLDDERQREVQGALVCQDWPGPDDEEGPTEDQFFAASDISDSSSLHGLVAFFVACYGLGTSTRDSFDQDPFGKARRLAWRPFISRLPQRLLAHPRGGALAVIGHVDRAWTMSFAGFEGRDTFVQFLTCLLEGETVGWAMEFLNQRYANFAAQLNNLWQARRLREPVDEERFSQVWCLCNDARNYIIFGDPAVRLPGVGEPR